MELMELMKNRRIMMMKIKLMKHKRIMMKIKLMELMKHMRRRMMKMELMILKLGLGLELENLLLKFCHKAL